MSPAEKAATIGCAVLAGVVAVVGTLVVVVASVVVAYESNRCDVPPTGQVRNHHMVERPTCRDGELTLTTPRESMHEDTYGWNCFFDGDGTCGTEGLTEHEPFCLTVDDDGYTMCQDGRVYHRTTTGAKLDPVLRDPDPNGA